MSMDKFLAEYYGTNKTASAPEEDLEKQASVDLFLKLASEQGIDLKSMPDAQVQQLYSNWSEKRAEAEKAAAAAPAPEAKVAEDEKEKLKEKAKEEHEEKKAAAEKVAEADFCGRVMAHSFVQELRNISAEEAKTAGAKGAPAAGIKVAEMPEAFKKHMEGKGEEKHEEKKDEKKDEKHEEKKEHENPFAKKEGSAIDALAASRAVVMAKEAGFDPEQAGRKVAAVLELNLIGESAKVASAPDVEMAVGIRALELLEKAGYPVTWEEPKK